MAWRVRGATFASKGEHAKQLANYTESIRLDPDSPENLHHRAVVLSACMDDKIRDGKQAVKDATRASELTEWKNPLYITMLAAAYAECGDFEAAVKWEQKVNELSGRPADAGRVAQYRKKEPFRMTWR
jgi:tetratricopeptide (TPR) repeat protein